MSLLQRRGRTHMNVIIASLVSDLIHEVISAHIFWCETVQLECLCCQRHVRTRMDVLPALPAGDLTNSPSDLGAKLFWCEKRFVNVSTG